jgi:hypothetical protein
MQINSQYFAPPLSLHFIKPARIIILYAAHNKKLRAHVGRVREKSEAEQKVFPPSFKLSLLHELSEENFS